MSILSHTIDDIAIFIAAYDDIDRSALSSSQLADISGMANEKRRRERELTYTLINHAAEACGRYAMLAGAALCHLESGAPFLKTGLQKPIEIAISISHCRTGACIALSEHHRHFGIDIEDTSDKLERVASKFINDNETRFMTGRDMLLCAWTIKEAVYKAAATAGLPLRDGIGIKAIGQRAGDPVSHFPVESTITAAGKSYRGYSRIDSSRCITLCRRI